jgi:hypothetical protein
MHFVAIIVPQRAAECLQSIPALFLMPWNRVYCVFVVAKFGDYTSLVCTTSLGIRMGKHYSL